ncbi:MAG: hypothetical protein ABI338_02470, partial [Gemmatimonadaceae bacterium]
MGVSSKAVRSGMEIRKGAQCGAAVLLAFLLAGASLAAQSQARSEGAGSAFTLKQILSYPFVPELAASPTSSRIAWVIDRMGVRNVWSADAPDFKARPITTY